MAVHVFGIRHHGPGSARSLMAALARLEPDCILVEGPVEGTDQIAWIGRAEFRPPVALLVFRPDEPLSSVFYPFACFSPEWNALRFAVERQIPVRFMDLPKAHWMALEKDPECAEPDEDDPLRTIAQLAGEEDFERWWDRVIENRGETGVFPAIHEAMDALRRDGGRPSHRIDLLREAAMRQQIRQAEREGHERVAVVCGAWHAPALTERRTAKEDTALLKGMAKVKVETTWVPWTHGRLQRASGYGAGVESPGWYEHLWTTPDETAIRWTARVAQLLREQDLSASPAQVVDAVRLAETLAALRGKARAALAELNDATEAALLFGNPAPMRLIRDRLIAGEVLGEVPAEVPAAPIQRDLEALQKKLRLKPEAIARTVDLDLRKEGDRERSQLLHRLQILGIGWGVREKAQRKLGTFHELWRLIWEPEFAVELIAAARWGNTVESAAAGYACHRAEQATALPNLTELIEPVLQAALPDAAAVVLRRVRDVAAVAPDVGDLMDTIPPLARVARYGDVRQTDQETVRRAIDELLTRICAGMTLACGSLDDAAARVMKDRILAVHRAITVFEESLLLEMWRETLTKLVAIPHGHGLVSGRCCRLLFDLGSLSENAVAAHASQALSPGTDAGAGGAWVEGFLEDAGSVLLAHERLWAVVDSFVQALSPGTFQSTLPLLRRTFSTFSPAERRQLGERVRDGGTSVTVEAGPRLVDEQRGALALPLLIQILDLEGEPQ